MTLIFTSEKLAIFSILALFPYLFLFVTRKTKIFGLHWLLFAAEALGRLFSF
jgi:hypothetical protein